MSEQGWGDEISRLEITKEKGEEQSQLRRQMGKVSEGDC